MITPNTHLIIVAPHPDDETIALGGTIHDHVRSGGTVEVIAVTDGEAADDQADERAREALRITRNRERQDALALLGAGHAEVTRLRLPDRSVDEHEPDLARTLEQRFLHARGERRACLVAMTWRHDPHPDHQSSARAAIAAAAVTSLAHVEVPIWASYQQKGLAFDNALYRRITPEGRDAKRAALQAFRSQTEPLPGGRGPVLPACFLATFDQAHEVLLR
jgi:LmbE family N-acetylglucosaminyl deacetylase